MKHTTGSKTQSEHHTKASVPMDTRKRNDPHPKRGAGRFKCHQVARLSAGHDEANKRAWVKGSDADILEH